VVNDGENKSLSATLARGATVVCIGNSAHLVKCAAHMTNLPNSAQHLPNCTTQITNAVCATMFQEEFASDSQVAFCKTFS